MSEAFVLGVQLDGVCAVRPPAEEPMDYARRPVVEGAADALWRLSDAGAWIRILTHRLSDNWGHRTAVIETVEWLDEARIPYRDLCFLGAKPEVEADLYVDDDPDDIRKLRNKGNDVIVFDAPGNVDLRDPRAEDWVQLEELVMARLTKHSGVHGVPLQLPGVEDPQRVKDIVFELKARDRRESNEHLGHVSPWGRSDTLEHGATHEVRRIEVAPDQEIALESTPDRAETWVVVS